MRTEPVDDRPDELCGAPPDPDSATAWMAEGNCRLHPPATFFPSDGVGVDRARKICKGCPVGEQCLEYALENDERFGIWGGLSERERRRIRRSNFETVLRGHAIACSRSGGGDTEDGIP